MLIKEKLFEQRLAATRQELLDPISGEYSVSYQKEWENLNANFSRNKFSGADSYLNVGEVDFILLLAARNAAPEAYTKIVKKYEQSIENFKPDTVAKPEDCIDQPQN